MIKTIWEWLAAKPTLLAGAVVAAMALAGWGIFTAIDKASTYFENKAFDKRIDDLERARTSAKAEAADAKAEATKEREKRTALETELATIKGRLEAQKEKEDEARKITNKDSADYRDKRKLADNSLDRLISDLDRLIGNQGGSAP